MKHSILFILILLLLSCCEEQPTRSQLKPNIMLDSIAALDSAINEAYYNEYNFEKTKSLIITKAKIKHESSKN